MNAAAPGSTDTQDAEVISLFDRARHAHGRARDVLENEIVRRHLDLARSLALRYADRGAERDDLIQVASLALVKAMHGFDETKGMFAPYAAATIRGELKKHFRDRCWVVRPPRRVQELQAEITDLAATWLQRTGHAPAATDVADELGIDVATVHEARAASGCFAPASLDHDRNDGLRWDQRLPDPAGDLTSGVDDRVSLRPAIDALDVDDRELIRLRFVEELTQQQIADRVGVSQMQVSRRLARALERLRTSLTDEPLAG